MGQNLTINCGSAHSQQLVSAIREGDSDLVERMIDEEPKLLNAGLFYDRHTPLHIAAAQGQLQVLSMLLERGANPNGGNGSGRTPLMLACKSGRWECIEPLLNSGANILAFDNAMARTCLHYACRGGHTECVRRTLDAARRGPVANSWGFVRFVNVRDYHGATALHMASRMGHADVVRLLLDGGALVSSTTSVNGNGPGHGSSPIHYAARGGSVECVRELLAWGADRAQRDVTGHTAFGIAMKYSNSACAALLNPQAAEPLVWPSPWKFMKEGELEPEAKTLLEAALARANNEREREIVSQTKVQEAKRKKSKRVRKRQETLGSILLATPPQKAEFPPAKPLKEEEVRPAVTFAEEALQSSPTEDNSGNIGGVQEVCCICFEHFCTIEVMECGHQMCATCTLSLCCHSKPNPAVPYSPPPACPFCRRNIGHLILARPKPKLLEPKDKSKARKLRRARPSSKGGSGGKGSFSGSLLSFSGRLGSSRRLGASGRIPSGRIADVEWMNMMK